MAHSDAQGKLTGVWQRVHAVEVRDPAPARKYANTPRVGDATPKPTSEESFRR